MYIVGHLRGGSGGAIIIVNHTVVELTGHAYDHVVEIGVEMFPLGHVQTLGGLVVVSS